MAKRGSKAQSKHDKKVESLAKSLQTKKFKVQADIPGFDKPKSINRRRPDIVAKKGIKTKIIEVETPKSVEADKKQHKTFQNYVDKSKNRDFEIKITR